MQQCFKQQPKKKRPKINSYVEFPPHDNSVLQSWVNNPIISHISIFLVSAPINRRFSYTTS